MLAVSLKIHTDLRAGIEKPEEVTEELLKARANTQYWLFLAGGLVLGMALVAAWFTSDYLKEYGRMAAGSNEAVTAGGVEVIEVFPEDTASRVAETGAEGTGEGESGPVEAVTEAGREGTGGTGPATAAARESQAAAPSSTAFNREDFKKNQATFRGYMGQGVSYARNIPVDWDGPSGMNIKWKVAFSKPGFNSPVLWGDKLFISGGDEEALVVSCYNRHTGQLLWEREVTGIPGSPAAMPKVENYVGLAAPTMAVDGNRVYAIFANADIIAFDLNGHKVWGRNLGVPSINYGYASSLQEWDGKVVVQYYTNGRKVLMALAAASGNTLWEVNVPVNASWSSPMLIEVDGKIQVVTTADPYVMGHDLETGSEAWKVEALFGEVAPSPACTDGLVFATMDYARTLGVKPGAAPQVVWADDEYTSEIPSPVAHDGLFYLATAYGVLVCYDAATGEKYWERELDKDVYSSPMIVDGKLYLIDHGGITHIIRADKSGTVIAKPALGEPGNGQPAFADGVIYFRGTKNLYCVGK